MRTGTLFKQAAFAPGPNSFEQGANISPMSNVLRRWHEPGCKLALWERSLDADFVRQLDQLPIGALPAARLTVSLETVRCLPPFDAGGPVAVVGGTVDAQADAVKHFQVVRGAPLCQLAPHGAHSQA